MDFKPFFQLLDELGIVLPNAFRLRNREQQQQKPQNRERSESTPRSDVRSAEKSTSFDRSNFPIEAELLEDLELILGFRAPAPALDPLAESDRHWVSPGEIVEIAGYRIPGMIYVGEQLATLRGHGIEPSLINAELRISRKNPDFAGKTLPPHLAYHQLPMTCRSAYLDWLATGRERSDIDLRYLWIFFYGLERRVFHDLLQSDLKRDSAKQQELDQIMAEVQRLNAHYGNDYQASSFRHKADIFLELCHLIRSHACTNTDPFADRHNLDPQNIPLLTLQITLGQFVQQKQPIPADWAIAWYTRLSRNALPTAATRCPAEFHALFQLRYAQKFGAGMQLKPGKSYLRIGYFPASSSFGRAVEVNIGGIPDLSRFTTKLNQIAEIVQACRTELDPLSRLLARNPAAQGTSAAIALLPPDVLNTHGGEVIAALKQWLDRLFAGSDTQIVVVAGQELLQYWSGTNAEKLTPTEAIGLSKFLEQLGYGIEPDSRLSRTTPNRKSNVALFRLTMSVPAELSPDYAKATLISHLAIATASGTEPLSDREQHYLKSYLLQSHPTAALEPILQLSEADQPRLQAHIQYLIAQQPTLRNLKSKIEQLPLTERPAIARFLISVAAADGQLNPSEIKQLEKAYTLLELDPQSLYSNIHDLSTTEIRPAIETNARDRSVPLAKDSSKSRHQPSVHRHRSHSPDHPAIELDMSLIQHKIAESEKISQLLSDIFTDDPPSTPAPLPTPVAEHDPSPENPNLAIIPIAGLDAPHSQLLRTLSQQETWQRQTLEPIASQLNLMLDGALEVINELAFDRCDEALIEGHDPVEVNPEVMQELLAHDQ